MVFLFGFLYNKNMNNGRFYSFLYKRFHRYKHVVRLLNKIFTLLMYIVYPLLLMILWDDAFLWKAVLVPSVSFVIVTVIRSKINRLRPYEAWSIRPLIQKDTKGQSMPSRHVFSSVIISMTILYLNKPLGIFFLIVSFLEACIRVIAGLHYVSDVLVGYILGILFGLIYFI